MRTWINTCIFSLLDSPETPPNSRQRTVAYESEDGTDSSYLETPEKKARTTWTSEETKTIETNFPEFINGKSGYPPEKSIKLFLAKNPKILASDSLPDKERKLRVKLNNCKLLKTKKVQKAKKKLLSFWEI